MARTLLQAETIARYRIMACLSVGASWRKLPRELWDKVFVFYLDKTQVQAKRVVLRPRPEPGPGSYLAMYLQAMRSVPSLAGLLPDDRSGERVDQRVMNAPLPLLAVCHAWRAAVLSTPSIWSNVVIPSVATETAVGTVPFIASSDAARLMPRLRRITMNPVPWSLTIVEKPGPEPSQSTSGEGLALPLSMVLFQSEVPFESIKFLKIIMDPSNSPYFHGQFNLDSTSSLVLWCNRKPSNDRLDRPPRVPNLKKGVFINAVNPSVGGLPSNIPWSQLTHLLVVGNLNGKRIRDFLTLCSSLRRGAFQVEADEDLESSDQPDAPANAQPTLSSIEALDIVGPCVDDMGLHLRVPLDISFPALTRTRIFGRYESATQLPAYLQPFHSLTHLSLVVCGSSRWAVHSAGFYDIGDILDCCPLLVELVASLQGRLDAYLGSLVFNLESRRGRHLQVLALLCDLKLYFGSLQGGRIPFEPFLENARNIVASRRQPNASSDPALLQRFILRFTDDLTKDSSGLPFDRRTSVDHLKRWLRNSLKPYVDAGLQLSIESISQRLADFELLPRGRHWDEGAMDFVDEHWEFSASMPPPSQ